MAYIVPKEIPKSCHDCQFHYCSEYHPFWSADKEKRNTQTIRCQAITPFRSTILDIKDTTFKADWCPLVDAADVVPRAEVARKIIGDVANAIWEGEPDSLNISVGKRYYNKKEFIAELKKKYTEGSDEG